MDRQPRRGPFDVVALVASAGGVQAIKTVLEDLPGDFPLALVAMQHLAPQQTDPGRYGRRLRFAVARARTGSELAPGKLLVCPARSFVELMPDGTCEVSPCGSTLEKPIDRLLESVARSFGERAIAVVLSGMGDDGAAGARKVQLAGGTVLVQSEASAEHPAMPRAAIESGAANLVVPLQDLGRVLRELVAGTPRPTQRSEIEAAEALFPGPGKAQSALRARDWAATSLGPIAGWSLSLRTTVRTVMSTTYAAAF